MIKNVMVLSPVRLGVDGSYMTGLHELARAGFARVLGLQSLGSGWAGFKFTSTSNLANGPGFAGLARVGLH